ncbi:MAG: cyclodeaminase/cyclohydrolase family protein [Candidatus Scalinduaceae bacterium]
MNDVSSETSTPGGGSVSALVGALGTSMASMSATFTLGREEFEDVEPRIKEIREKCRDKREELLRLMEEDIGAYNGVSRAYALSKSNEHEKRKRSVAIQSALEKATDVPLRVMRCSLGLLEHINELVKITNPNLITDVGVAGLLANAAFKGSMLNVEINLNHIKNKKIVNAVKKETEKALKSAERLSDNIMKKVKKTMNK